MIRLVHLKLRNFRSFKTLDLDFPTSGMVLINGESGAGKSNILLGIAFALNIAPDGLTQADFQSFFETEAAQVELKFEDTITGDLWTVCRGGQAVLKKSGCEIKGSKAVQEKLDEIIGINSTVLSSMVFRPQRTNGLFLSKNSTEKLEYLSYLLGLDKIESAIEIAKQNVVELDGGQQWLSETIAFRKKNINDQLVDQTEPLRALEERRKASEAEEARHKVVMEEFNQTKLTALEQVKAQKDSINGSYQQKIATANKLLAETTQSDMLRKAEIDKSNSEIRKQILDLTKNMAKVEEDRRTIKRLESELVKLKQNKCHACDQTLSFAEAKIMAHEKQIEDLMASGVNTDQIAISIKDLESKIQGFDPNPVINSLRDAEYKLQKSLYFALQEVKEPDVQAPHFTPSLPFAQFLSERSLLEFQQKAWLKQQSEKEAIAVEEKMFLDTQQRLKDEKDFISLIGPQGFMGAIVNEVLSEIATKTNQYLSSVPNTSSITIGFDVEKTTSKNTIKKSIVPFVYLAGVKTNLKSLSGGMTSAVELAVDLAVSDVIEKRTGKSLGWICLDEVFDGLGGSKESVVDILSRFGNNKLVIVIDHGSEFKELFTKTINVVKEGQSSSISTKE